MQYSTILALLSSLAALTTALPTPAESQPLSKRNGPIITCYTQNEFLLDKWSCHADVNFQNGNDCDHIYNRLSGYSITGWNCAPDGDGEHTFLGFNTPPLIGPVTVDDIVGSLKGHYATDAVFLPNEDK